MKTIARAAAVMAFAAFITGCSTATVSDWISGATDTTKEERCLGYKTDLLKAELALEVLGASEERMARIDKYQALVDIECAGAAVEAAGDDGDA